MTDLERIEPLTGEIVPAGMLDKTTDSWTAVVSEVAEFANYICHTEFVPKGLRGSPEKVTAAILHGRELGLPPMTSLSMTDVIEGKPSLSSEGARALVLAAGHELQYGEMSSQRCSVRGRRKGWETWTTVEWTMADANRAGLTSKTNWKTHPRRMLQARATAELCKLIFPDVIHGMGMAEEMMDEATDDGPTGAVPPEPKRTSTVQRKPRTRKPSAPPEPAAPAVPTMETPEPPQPHSRPVADPLDVPLPTPPPTVFEAKEPVEAEVIEHTPAKVSPAQLRMLGALWNGLGVTDDQERRDYTSVLIGRELEGGSTKDLTKSEATELIDTLTGAGKDRDALEQAINDRIAERGDR